MVLILPRRLMTGSMFRMRRRRDMWVARGGTARLVRRRRPLSRERTSERVISATRGSRNGALDGLRGLAVIAVMAYHVVPDPFTGGWLGVDVFLVLSGFLICSMLLRERERTQGIDYVRFLRRRAQRLLPGLALVLLAVLGAAMVFETAGRRRDVAIDVLSSALQVSNWRLIQSDASYFAKVAAPSPIRHTWSLGVQEQFYVVFPLVLLALFAWVRSYRSMALVFGAIATLSLASMIYLYEPGTDPSRVYFGTETRLFELLIGVIGAIVLHQRARSAQRRRRPVGPRSWSRREERWIGWLGLACLALLVVWMFTVDEFSPWLFTGGIAVIGLMTMVIITAATSPIPNVMTRLLAVPPLMKAGDMSYSLYIWHWPIIIYLAPMMQGTSELARQIAAVVATVVISSLSYTYVENPIHRHGLRGLSRQYPRLGHRLATVAVPLVALGAVTLGTTTGAASNSNVAVELPADPHYGTPVAELSDDVTRHDVVLVGASTAARLDERGELNQTPDIDVAVEASFGCAPYARDEVLEGGQPPESADCVEFRRSWPQAVQEADSPTVVFFLPTRMLTDFTVDGSTASPPSAEYDEQITGILDEMKQTAVDEGASRFAVINLSCHQRPDFGDNLSVTRSNDTETVKHLNEVVSTWAEGAGADVYDSYELLCPGDQYFENVNGQPLYDDGLHYSTASSPLMWQWVASEVRRGAADDEG